MYEISSGAIELSLFRFGLVYVLLFIVLGIMRYARADSTKLMFIGSVRMTVQMVIIGFVLEFIFGNPRPVFTVLFIACTTGFAIYRVLAVQKDLNLRFKFIVVGALVFSGMFTIFYFVFVIVQVSFFNPQYTIPLAGMLIGNAMNGISLGLKSFMESIKNNRPQIGTMLNIGASPDAILKPHINTAIETALLPTINSMLGMGIVFLPGMVTGQILSGTLPTTAIMYQIAISISISAAVCLAVFLSLKFGSQTLYNKKNQIQF
jgi:putative ABC transport system permease protein